MLWSEAARQLAAMGHTISASVYRWPEPAAQLSSLRQAGIEINERWFAAPSAGPLILRRLLGFLIRSVSPRIFEFWLARKRPSLICVSMGSPAEDISLVSLCARRGVPYVIIVQANAECLWPNDSRAQTLINVFQGALRTFFVSHRNRALMETQLGIALPNAEIVRNPFNVRRCAAIPWPSTAETIRLACVARLEPQAKGQDLLLNLLASQPWNSRPIVVSFFGKGQKESGLRRLAIRLNLEKRVSFCGHVDNIETIWATHHALVLPSRFEGLPLAIVEAMFCSRPVIATDVAGNAEFLKDGVTGFLAEAATEHHLHLALDRAWASRSDWRNMGERAADSIRKLLPSDPVEDFARKLLSLLPDGRHRSR